MLKKQTVTVSRLYSVELAGSVPRLTVGLCWLRDLIRYFGSGWAWTETPDYKLGVIGNSCGIMWRTWKVTECHVSCGEAVFFSMVTNCSSRLIITGELMCSVKWHHRISLKIQVASAWKTLWIFHPGQNSFNLVRVFHSVECLFVLSHSVCHLSVTE